jgi:acyl-CoA synthetase (AMP-forming)/AMP-acid ligase II
LTYGELCARSDRLAASLEQEMGDNRSPIAVIGHKEPEMLIAFLAAVKSGRSLCADRQFAAGTSHRQHHVHGGLAHHR